MPGRLKQLRLTNFRGFRDHTVDFDTLNILVGANNAGKSTIIEALRLASLAQKRCRSASYKPTPEWVPSGAGSAGFAFSTKTIDFEHINVCHNYSDDPAHIIARFSNNITISIFLGPSTGQIFSILRQSRRKPIISPSRAAAVNFSDIRVMPPISPLLVHERILDKRYLRDGLDSRLAHRHFRNQLMEMVPEYRHFEELAEKTWRNFRIRALEPGHGEKGDEISFQVQDGPFVTEIGFMGHGLQAWLQTLWFLARIPKESTIVLDEPDVYLHADLQRKLVRILRSSHKQVIIATHSADIIADANPESIIIVEKRNSASKSSTSIPHVQSILDRLGTVHNLQLAKLARSKKILFVEGKDFHFLSKLFHIIFPDESDVFSSTPTMAIGGRGNWRTAAGAAKALCKHSSSKFMAYFISDTDYSLSQTKEKIITDSQKYELHVHFLERKEIENYLISACAISRVINKRMNENYNVIRPQDVEGEVCRYSENIKSEIVEKIADEISVCERNWTPSACMKGAGKLVEESWEPYSKRLRILPGKDLLSHLSAWAQERWKVSFSAGSIADELSREEIPEEIVGLLRKINDGIPLSSA